jgi:uncharacterized UBP type Zn finger protein
MSSLIHFLYCVASSRVSRWNYMAFGRRGTKCSFWTAHRTSNIKNSGESSYLRRFVHTMFFTSFFLLVFHRCFTFLLYDTHRFFCNLGNFIFNMRLYVYLCAQESKLLQRPMLSKEFTCCYHIFCAILL